MTRACVYDCVVASASAAHVTKRAWSEVPPLSNNSQLEDQVRRGQLAGFVAVSLLTALTFGVGNARASAPVQLRQVGPSRVLYDFAIADFDGDGIDDAAYVSGGQDVRLTFSSTPGYETSVTIPTTQISQATVAAAGDWDGDGDPDLAVFDQEGWRFNLISNNGNGTFAAPVHGWGLDGSYAGAAVPISTGAGSAQDFAIVYRSYGKVVIGPYMGWIAPGMKTSYTVAWGASDLKTADVNHDGRTDMFVLVPGDSSRLLLSNGAGGWSQVLLPGGGAWSLDAADFDGDGEIDFVKISDVTGRVEVWRGDGTGNFVEWRDLGRGPQGWTGLFAGDLNGDGLNDVGVYAPWGLGVYRGRGVSGFRPEPDLSFNSSQDWRSAKIGQGQGGVFRFLAASLGSGFWEPVAPSADATAPVTEVVPSYLSSDGTTWVSGLSLLATDEGWGVAQTYWTEGESLASTYTAPVPMEEGLHSVSLYSVDEAGNREATKTVDLGVDTTAPTTTSDTKALYDNSASITLTATDGALSGVANTEWRLDGIGWTSGTVVGVSAAGIHTLEFRSTDEVGNVESANTVTFEVRHPATIALTTNSASSLPYGFAFVIKGTLKANGIGLANQRVILQAGTSPSSIKDSSLVATTGAGGVFSFTVKPAIKAYYRVRFAGAVGYGAWMPFTSVYVLPRIYVGKPVAPTTMSHTKSHTIYGYLKPRHLEGTYPVRIYKYRYVSGKWRSYGYVNMSASNYSTYTKYSGSVRLPYAGKWRVRSYAPADSGHAATWSSGSDYVTVK